MKSVYYLLISEENFKNIWKVWDRTQYINLSKQLTIALMTALAFLRSFSEPLRTWQLVSAEDREIASFTFAAVVLVL